MCMRRVSVVAGQHRRSNPSARHRGHTNHYLPARHREPLPRRSWVAEHDLPRCRRPKISFAPHPLTVRDRQIPHVGESESVVTTKIPADTSMTEPVTRPAPRLLPTSVPEIWMVGWDLWEASQSGEFVQPVCFMFASSLGPGFGGCTPCGRACLQTLWEGALYCNWSCAFCWRPREGPSQVKGIYAVAFLLWRWCWKTGRVCMQCTVTIFSSAKMSSCFWHFVREYMDSTDVEGT